MAKDWLYDGSIHKWPVKAGERWSCQHGSVAIADLYKGLPAFVRQADCLFVDPPWNLLRAELTMVGDTDLGELLSTLEFELQDEAPPIDPYAPPARPAATGSGPAGRPLAVNDYHEVTCSKCGNTMFIPKSGRAKAAA